MRTITNRSTAHLIWSFAITILLIAGNAFTDEDAETDADKKQAATSPEFVQMTTSKGDIYLELNREKAPISVENFVKYVEDEFYDGTIFHRVIPTFMIQGGGFTEDMQQKPKRDSIKNEWQNGLKNERGTIAMARTTAPDSATCQFFINVRDNPNLDQPISGGAGYAVFGKTIAGMDVVDVIRQAPTTNRGGHQNVPRETIFIEKVRTISEDDAMDAVAREQADDEEDDAEG